MVLLIKKYHKYTERTYDMCLFHILIVICELSQTEIGLYIYTALEQVSIYYTLHAKRKKPICGKPFMNGQLYKLCQEVLYMIFKMAQSRR